MESQHLDDHRSVTILKVAENVGLLPIIGPMNEMIMPDVLQLSYKSNFEHLVIDLSGSTSIWIDDLSKMILTLEHIGVHTIVSGLRPDTVKNVGDGDIPFDTKRCYLDLYHALISLGFPMDGNLR